MTRRRSLSLRTDRPSRTSLQFAILPRLADRTHLARLPQHWFLAPGWENPFAKPAVLPRRLSVDQTTAFTLELAPPEGGWKGDARLRVQTLAPLTGQRLVVNLNGEALVPSDDLAEPFPNPDPPLLGTPETLAAWIAPAALLRDGANRVEITLTTGESVDVAFLDLASK